MTDLILTNNPKIKKSFLELKKREQTIVCFANRFYYLCLKTLFQLGRQEKRELSKLLKICLSEKPGIDDLRYFISKSLKRKYNGHSWNKRLFAALLSFLAELDHPVDIKTFGSAQPIFYLKDEDPTNVVNILPDYEPLLPDDFKRDPCNFIEDSDYCRPLKGSSLLISSSEKTLNDLVREPKDYTAVKIFSITDNEGNPQNLVSKRLDLIKINSPEEEIEVASHVSQFLGSIEIPVQVQRFIACAFSQGNFYLISLYDGSELSSEDLANEEVVKLYVKAKGAIMASGEKDVQDFLIGLLPRNILIQKDKEDNSQYTIIDFEKNRINKFERSCITPEFVSNLIKYHPGLEHIKRSKLSKLCEFLVGWCYGKWSRRPRPWFHEVEEVLEKFREPKFLKAWIKAGKKIKDPLLFQRITVSAKKPEDLIEILKASEEEIRGDLDPASQIDLMADPGVCKEVPGLKDLESNILQVSHLVVKEDFSLEGETKTLIESILDRVKCEHEGHNEKYLFCKLVERLLQHHDWKMKDLSGVLKKLDLKEFDIESSETLNRRPVFYLEESSSENTIRILPKYQSYFPKEFLTDPAVYIESSINLDDYCNKGRARNPWSIGTLLKTGRDHSRLKVLPLKDQDGHAKVFVSKRVDLLRSNWPGEEVRLAEKVFNAMLEEDLPIYVINFIGAIFSRGNFYLLSLLENKLCTLDPKTGYVDRYNVRQPIDKYYRAAVGEEEYKHIETKSLLNKVFFNVTSERFQKFTIMDFERPSNSSLVTRDS